ncbi:MULTISPECIES: phage holin family protein [unclassified Arthrobacter]|uniref:phage holin family protein n=1 Tax=unclassified Arthrobacter TaxID=235627 RepID=UPI00159DBA01|nr:MULTISPECIES: phage holin family protein [unclassified Arthrobacter]MCQ9163471.1 phage holin family protein [Arthrobacter sp. STN4]NVM97668.1 phage holin family protein [Arthrobacter sp. SDTb3-6]
MAVAQQAVHTGSKDLKVVAGPNLVEAVKTTARLVPRQVNDEIELAKLELGNKKSRLGGIAVFAVLALVFLALLVIALVVAAVAGLGTVLPLWLSALVISAAFLVLTAIAALVAYGKFKALLPLLPENAWRGIRHDLGIAKEGRTFDASTLEHKTLSKAEKKARKAAKEAAKEKAGAEQAAKAAEHGPKASQDELIKRTEVRREHLGLLREELLEQADVKKQAAHYVDLAKGRAAESARAAATGALSHGLETAKTRWKPLAVFAVSAAACVVFLRKLFKK